MGRNRRTDRHLPAKVYLEHGAYYYRDGKKPRQSLGRDLGEALAKYSGLIGNTWSLRTLGDVIDKYRVEILPLKKSEQTRKEEGKSLERLKIAPGHFEPLEGLAFLFAGLFAFLERQDLDPVLVDHITERPQTPRVTNQSAVLCERLAQIPAQRLSRLLAIPIVISAMLEVDLRG